MDPEDYSLDDVIVPIDPAAMDDWLISLVMMVYFSQIT